MRRMKGPATRIKSKKYIMLSPGANIVVIFQLSWKLAWSNYAISGLGFPPKIHIISFRD